MKSPNDLSEEIAVVRERLKKSSIAMEDDALEGIPIKAELRSFIKDADFLYNESKENQKLNDLFEKDPSQARDILFRLVAPIHDYFAVAFQTPQSLKEFADEYNKTLNGKEPNPIIKEAYDNATIKMMSADDLSPAIKGARKKIMDATERLGAANEKTTLQDSLPEFVKNAVFLFNKSEENEKLEKLYEQDKHKAENVRRELVKPIQDFIKEACPTLEDVRSFNAMYKKYLFDNNQEANPEINMVINDRLDLLKDSKKLDNSNKTPTGSRLTFKATVQVAPVSSKKGGDGDDKGDHKDQLEYKNATEKMRPDPSKMKIIRNKALKAVLPHEFKEDKTGDYAYYVRATRAKKGRDQRLDKQWENASAIAPDTFSPNAKPKASILKRKTSFVEAVLQKSTTTNRER